ncbi:hypothetical protein ACC754_37820, partial [Rhizobium johnstonii]
MKVGILKIQITNCQSKTRPSPARIAGRFLDRVPMVASRIETLRGVDAGAERASEETTLLIGIT